MGTAPDSVPTVRARRMSVERGVAAISMAVPLAALACAALFWVRDGVDLPFIDDWRSFVNGTAGSLAFADLFRPSNDTIYATGKFLDALAVRFLGFNGVVYQLLSLIVCLGLLLYIQFRLLFRNLPVSAASLGALTCIFMLQPYSYWGLQNLAYHQALPLMGLLGGVALTVSTRIPNLALAILVTVISVIGGLSYISGAIVALTTAFALFALSNRGTPDAARRMRFAALGFAVGALATLPVQLWVILIVQAGQTHSESIPWTFPWQPEFWVFLLGLTGRSVGAQLFTGLIAIGLAILVTAGLAATAIACVLRLRRSGQTLEEIQVPAVYLTLFCGIGAYAILVTASRASHGAAAGAPLYDWFLRSGVRFHYFWLTLLLPWAVAVGFAAFRDRFALRAPHAISIVLSTVLVGYAAQAGMFSYSPFYQTWAKWRLADLDCIQEKLLAQQPLVCGGLWAEDLTEAVRHARSLDTNFTRYLLFRDEIRSDHNMLLRPLQDLSLPSVMSVEGAQITPDAGGAEITSHSDDPQLALRFDGDSARRLQECRTLHAKGSIAAREDDILQMFVTTPSKPKYNQENSIDFPYGGGGPQPFKLVIGSREGFLPSVRFDPGTRNQTYTITDVTYSCR